MWYKVSPSLFNAKCCLMLRLNDSKHSLAASDIIFPRIFLKSTSKNSLGLLFGVVSTCPSPNCLPALNPRSWPLPIPLTAIVHRLLAGLGQWEILAKVGVRERKHSVYSLPSSLSWSSSDSSRISQPQILSLDPLLQLTQYFNQLDQAMDSQTLG